MTAIRFGKNGYLCLCGYAMALTLSLCSGADAFQEKNKKADKQQKTKKSKRIDFDKHVRPIFAKYCIKCHGPKKVESEFRVDRRQSFLEGGDYGEPMVVPGKSDKSRLIPILQKTDEDLKMPPSWGSVPKSDIQIIKDWIDQGAKMPKPKQAGDTNKKNDKKPPVQKSDHWSLQPVRSIQPPELNDKKINNAIDKFIRRKLDENRLKPSNRASRIVLIRRLYLVMLGVPPTPDEVSEFLNDRRPDAWPRLVDKVLADPRYGERWAQHWLDVARFGETDGFETNRERPSSWRYRDWVIQSLNSDKPYDQFVREQIAGDALNEPVGPGFLVAGPYDIVKSPDINLTLMQRQDELADIVNTAGTAFLGLTIGCARCHDHKFDPISQVDYYAMQAVFAGVQHGERSIPADPDQKQKLADVARQIGKLQRQLNRFVPPTKNRFTFVDDLTIGSFHRPGVEILKPKQGDGKYAAGTDAGFRDYPGSNSTTPSLGGESYSWWNNQPGADFANYRPMVRGRFRVWISWGRGFNSHSSDAQYLLDADGNPETTDDQKRIASIDQRRPASIQPSGSKQRIDDGPLPETPLWSGLQNAGEHSFELNSSIILRGGKSGEAISADLVVLELIDPSEGKTHSLAELRKPISSLFNVERFDPVKTRRIRFEIKKTNGGQPCIDELEIFSGQKNIALATNDCKVSSSGNFPNHPIHKLKHINDGKYGNANSWISNSEQDSWVQFEFPAETTIERIVWARDRQAKFRDRTATDYRILAENRVGEWREIASSRGRLPQDFASPKPVEYEFDTASGEIAMAGKRQLDELRKLEGVRQSLLKSNMAYIGTFNPNPATTHRLHRGDPMAKREQVTPDTVRVIGSLGLNETTPEQQRRLEFARWVGSKNNPLTARVMVNRIWQYHFGTGLVSTSSDFGSNGTPPTHPELLDWLAAELMAKNWSIKNIHRQVLLSHTWQQSGHPDAAALKIDAGSRMLWRFPPRRLEAESIRDSMVFVSGVMDFKMGGPGFSAFEVQLENVRHYFPKKKYGPGDWRRMIYMTKIRQERESTFGAFDCPDGSQVMPNRSRSTTPLQALNLFNSQFVMQQAELLAKRLETETAARDQGKKQSTYAHIQLAYRLCYARNPSARELALARTFVERHSLQQFCRVLLNSNEFLFIP